MKKNTTRIIKPDFVIVEDSKAGYQFFNHICNQFSIPCTSASSKSKIYSEILKTSFDAYSRKDNVIIQIYYS